MTTQTTEEMKEAERLAQLFCETVGSKITFLNPIFAKKGILIIDRFLKSAEARGRRIGLEEAAKFVENKYVPYGPHKPVSDRTRKTIPETARLIANAIRALIQKGE